MRDIGRVILIAIIIIMPTIVYCSLFYASRVEKVITVGEKWVEGKEGVYHVTDIRGTVYIVNDDLFLGYFDSANKFAKLAPGQTYRVVVYGWRIPILSMFQNIQFVEDGG